MVTGCRGYTCRGPDRRSACLHPEEVNRPCYSLPVAAERLGQTDGSIGRLQPAHHPTASYSRRACVTQRPDPTSLPITRRIRSTPALPLSYAAFSAHCGRGSNPRPGMLGEGMPVINPAFCSAYTRCPFGRIQRDEATLTGLSERGSTLFGTSHAPFIPFPSLRPAVAADTRAGGTRYSSALPRRDSLATDRLSSSHSASRRPSPHSAADAPRISYAASLSEAPVPRASPGSSRQFEFEGGEPTPVVARLAAGRMRPKAVHRVHQPTARAHGR
jgi:hypothetical protein